MKRAVAAALLLLAAGCAQLPTVTPEIEAAAANRNPDPAAEAATLRAWGERIAQRPFVPRNSVLLLRDGPQTFGVMTDAIAAARTRIDMETYEFDALEGERFADALLARHADGVAVNLLLDAWGAKDVPAALVARLRDGGVQVLIFNPLVPNARTGLDLNQRDHRKLLVIDGRLAITGGINISHVYENTSHSSPDPESLRWRDTDIALQGPVVAAFQRIFVQNWDAQHGPPLPPPPATPAESMGQALVQALDGTPQHGRPEIYRSLLVSMTLATRSIHLTTGFFVPPPDMCRALEDAASRGVDVQVIVPARSDSTAAIRAGRTHYAELLRAGVRLYERQGAVLHAKTSVIDGLWSAIGSSNLDYRSVLFNDELDAVVLDHDFGARMEALFTGDLAASRQIDPAAWVLRPFGERVQEWRSALWERLL